MSKYLSRAATLAIFVLIGGCATSVPPDVVKGYRTGQIIEDYCAERGAKKGEAWILACTNEVAYSVNSGRFCQSCADKGGSLNECLRTADQWHETAKKNAPEGERPAIPLTCAKTSVSCMGYPDSFTERNMQASKDSRAKVDVDSYAGAYCPKIVPSR